MRTSENGALCPATLGEYRQLYASIGGENCEAVKLLDKKIKEHNERGLDGVNAEVIMPDSQMRWLFLTWNLPPGQVKVE